MSEVSDDMDPREFSDVMLALRISGFAGSKNCPVNFGDLRVFFP